jgi:hypothetical protein
MHTEYRSVIANVRGGFIGIVIYLVIYAVLFFMAFMIAFGNPTPAGTLILGILGRVLQVAHPLWMVPLSYLVGAYFIREQPAAS